MKVSTSALFAEASALGHDSRRAASFFLLAGFATSRVAPHEARGAVLKNLSWAAHCLIRSPRRDDEARESGWHGP